MFFRFSSFRVFDLPIAIGGVSVGACIFLRFSLRSKQLYHPITRHNTKMMNENGLPIASGPADHLRLGFSSLEQSHKAPHPIQVLQNQTDLEWALKLDVVRRTYGSHMAMRLATERKMLSRPRRLPGLESSNVAVSTMLGNAESIDFKDFLNGKQTKNLLFFPLNNGIDSSYDET